MSKRTSSLSLAFEEIENEEAAAAAAAVTEDEVTVVLDEEAVAVINDIEEQVSNGEEDVAEVEEASDDADDLEKIADAVEASGEEGEGMTATAAEITNVAVESIYRRRNLKKVMRMPAAEAFGDKGGRKMACEAAAQGLRENASKIWEGIIKFFQNAAAAVKQFFVKLLDGNERIIAAATKVHASAQALKSANLAPKEVEIPASGFGDKLTLGGKFAASEVVKGLGDLETFSKGALDGIAAFGKSAVGISNLSKHDELAAAEIKNVLFFKPIGTLKDGDNNTYHSAELLGNRAMKATFPADWKQSVLMSVSVFGKGKVSFGAFDDQAEGLGDTAVPTATPDEAVKITEAVLSLATSLGKKKAVIAELGKDLEAFVASIKKTMSENSENVRTKEVQSFLKRAGSVLQSVPSAIGANNVRTSQAALQYVSKSLAQYQTSPAAESAAA